jgi:hypothetical protein
MEEKRVRVLGIKNLIYSKDILVKLGCNRDILGCDWKKSNDCGVYCIFSSYDL